MTRISSQSNSRMQQACASIFAGCLAACSAVDGLYAANDGWKTLQYVGNAESAERELPLVRDCRTLAKGGSNRAFVIVKEGVRQAPHFIVSRYWVVPAEGVAGLRTGDDMHVNTLDCNVLASAVRDAGNREEQTR